MPRTALPVTVVPFQVEIDNLTLTAADFTNGNKYENDGQTVLVIRNPTGAGITATIKSVKDEAGRVGDLAVLVPATTGIGFVPPLRPAWWNQPSGVDAGTVQVDWSATGCTVAVLRITP